LQEFHDLRGVGGIKVAGRLIGEQHRGLMDQGAGDGRPLELAAAELVHAVIGAIREADKIDDLVRFPARCGERFAAQEQRQANVFANAHRREQVEELEDDAEFRPAVGGQFGFAGTVQRQPGDDDFTGGRCIESADQMHERALATAARAGDGDEFALRDLERDIVQRGHAGGITAGDVAQGNHS